MCEPISLTTGILLAASAGATTAATVVNYKNQKKEATQVQTEQDAYKAENDRSAAVATRLALGDLSQRELEEMIASSHEQQSLKLDANSAVSTAKVAAGEAGVTGSSVDALLADIKMQEGRNLTTSKTNLDIATRQLERQKQGVVANGVSQQNAVPNVKVNQPSLLSPLLQIGGQALGTIDYIQQRKTALKAAGE